MRIHVVAPATEEQRERVERGVFERLDALRGALAVPASDDRRDRVERGVFEQLAAIRGVERAERIAPTRRAARWIPAFALAGAAAVVAIVVLATRGGGDPAARTSSRFVVPPGQTTSFTEGDAVIVAGSDTSVEVVRGDGVTLALARGSVECDVAPRGGRPPFRVVAGDVTVEVVGTHFTVAHRGGSVRVDVAHGRVRVVAPAGETFVGAGETWSSTPPITAEVPPPSPAPADASDADLIDLEPAPAPPSRPAVSPADAYKAAERLEAKDRDAAARAYRNVADGRGAWAATALARLVEVERDRGRGASALRAIDEYLRRFPSGAAVEDVLWFRVEIHRTANRPDALRAAAADYLRRFPAGTYAKAAARFAPP